MRTVPKRICGSRVVAVLAYVAPLLGVKDFQFASKRCIGSSRSSRRREATKTDAAETASAIILHDSGVVEGARI